MARLPDGSLVKSFLTVSVVLSACALSSPVHSQQAGSRTSGAGVRGSGAPIHNIPISPAPGIHAPISTARTPTAPIAGGALGTLGFRPPRRPIRRFPAWAVYEFPSLLGGPFWGWNSCWSATCDLFWPWTLAYTTAFPGPTNYVLQASETPVYVYGEERADLPQLFLRDGTILNVTDYWLVDNQLHFTMIEEDSGKAAEHVIPFDALDLRTTVDANTRRGFRFMLRDEPFEQYVRDHPEGPPPVMVPPH